MGRQMRYYLLPQEADGFLSSLRSEIGLTIYPATNSTPSPQAQQHISSSPIAEHFGGLRYYPRVYLAPPPDLSPAIYTSEIRDAWNIEIESDVIELDSCAFDTNRLVQGRMYYQHDRLADNNIVPKNPDFVRWAEHIFRSAKRKLLWSKELEAYIGTEAELWRQQGGAFLERATSTAIQKPTLTDFLA